MTARPNHFRMIRFELSPRALSDLEDRRVRLAHPISQHRLSISIGVAFATALDSILNTVRRQGPRANPTTIFPAAEPAPQKLQRQPSIINSPPNSRKWSTRRAALTPPNVYQNVHRRVAPLHHSSQLLTRIAQGSRHARSHSHGFRNQPEFSRLGSSRPPNRTARRSGPLISAPCRNRTYNLVIKSHLLCQLS